MKRLIISFSLLIAGTNFINLSYAASPEAKHSKQVLPVHQTGKTQQQSKAAEPHISLTSWYGAKFHGRKTASGQKFNMHAMTAAHKTLPLLSYVKVTNLNNNRSVIVQINDRGPSAGNRKMDLSYAAAKELGIKSTAMVAVKPMSPEEVSSQLNKQDNS